MMFSLFFVVFFFGSLELGMRFFAKSKNEYSELIEQQGFKRNNKKSSEKRIFVVGESAARGVPYEMNDSFPGFLQKLLNESKNNNIKIINTGVPGRHSFYQKEEGRTLINYKADAVIYYAGNNDSRDFSNVMRDVPFAFLDFKLTWNSSFYSYFKRKIISLKKSVNHLSKKHVFDINYNQDDIWHWTNTYLNKKKSYIENPILGMERKMVATKDYENNLNDLTVYLNQRQVKVYVCSLPIVHKAIPGISDWSRKGYEFKQKVIFSNPNDEKKWWELFNDGTKALNDKNHPDAVQKFEAALKLNDTYPLLMHNLGLAYEGIGRYEQAKKMFTKGKDAQIQSPGGDSFKSAALKRISERNNAVLINVQSALEQVGEHGIVGMDLFLDHCHPNTLGHKVIAARIMQSLCETKLAACDPNANFVYWLEKLLGGKLSPESWAQEDLLTAFYHFNGTSWNDKPDYQQTVEYLEKARQILPQNKNIYPMLAASYWNLKRIDKAKENLKILSTLDSQEYQKTLEEFPYLKELEDVRR